VRSCRVRAVSSDACTDEDGDNDGNDLEIPEQGVSKCGVVVVPLTEYPFENGLDEDPVEKDDSEETGEEPAETDDHRPVLEELRGTDLRFRRRRSDNRWGRWEDGPSPQATRRG